jgi:pyruvate dehydrogenase (quinone)
MTQRKVADIIVEALQHAGVQRCYGVVGDTLNHVTDAIRHSEIAWVHVRHEEAAALAAGGEAYMPFRNRYRSRSSCSTTARWDSSSWR